MWQGGSCGRESGLTFFGSPNPDRSYIRCEHLSACDIDILWRVQANRRSRCAGENELSSGVLRVVEPGLLFVDDGSVGAGLAVSGSGQCFPSAASSVSERGSPAFGGSILRGMVRQRNASIYGPLGCRLERISLVVSWLCLHVHSTVKAIVIACTNAPPTVGTNSCRG